MLNTLIEILKYMAVILGIMIVGGIIGNIIAQPFKKKKQQEAVDKFTNKLDEIAKECIEELKKEEENKKKTTTKTRKKKEN